MARDPVVVKVDFCDLRLDRVAAELARVPSVTTEEVRALIGRLHAEIATRTAAAERKGVSDGR